MPANGSCSRLSASAPAAGLVECLGERGKSSKAKLRAQSVLRFCKATLPATVEKPVSAVHLIKRNPPGNEDPIQWFLLTTVDHAATAAEMIGYYLPTSSLKCNTRPSSQ